MKVRQKDSEEANKLIDDIASNGKGHSFSIKAKDKENMNNSPNEPIIQISDDEIEEISDEAIVAKTYPGKQEDKTWLEKFETGEQMQGGNGYRLLVQHMGIFRWQSAHGFRTGQNRGLMHLKPKFKNVKELSFQYLFSYFHVLI